MFSAVRDGRPATAMKSFSHVLDRSELEAVVDFIRREFMIAKASNTQYHTAANGWPNHERYSAAFPFALGEIAVDTPSEQLSAEQRHGLRLYLSSCITCHDRARVDEEGPIWEMRAVSYPRRHYSHRAPDAVSSASPYARHDQPPEINGLTAIEQAGQALFQKNCAFCHAADGTGKNWIGRFLEPNPRDLTDPRFMTGVTRQRLRHVIREGLPGTGMPAWKNVLNTEQIDNIVAYVNRAFHPLAQ